MDRTLLEQKTLQELRKLAAERKLPVGRRTRAQLIDALAGEAPAGEAPAGERHAGEPHPSGLLERAKQAVTQAAGKVEQKAHELAERVRRKEAPKRAPAKAPPSRRAAAATGAAPPSASASGPSAPPAPPETPAALEPLPSAETPAAPSDAAQAAAAPSEAPAGRMRSDEPTFGHNVAAAAEPSEPQGMLDIEELPETYGVDECELLYKDPHTVFAYWEVTDGGLASARAQLSQSAASARLVLRLFTTSSGSSGLEREVKDVNLQWNHGRTYFHVPRPGSHLRVAVGLLSAEGYFAPIAHSLLHRLPPLGPAGDTGPVEWMEVAPPKLRGKEPESPAIARRGPGQTESEAEPAWRAGQYHHAGRRLPYRPVDLIDDRGSSPWRPPVSPGKNPPEGKK